MRRSIQAIRVTDPSPHGAYSLCPGCHSNFGDFCRRPRFWASGAILTIALGNILRLGDLSAMTFLASAQRAPWEGATRDHCAKIFLHFCDFCWTFSRRVRVSTFVRMRSLAHIFAAFTVATEGRRHSACNTRMTALASGIGPCGYARWLTRGSSNVSAASLPDRELNPPEGSNGIHTSTFPFVSRLTDVSTPHLVRSSLGEREDWQGSFPRASLSTSVFAVHLATDSRAPFGSIK